LISYRLNKDNLAYPSFKEVFNNDVFNFDKDDFDLIRKLETEKRFYDVNKRKQLEAQQFNDKLKKKQESDKISLNKNNLPGNNANNQNNITMNEKPLSILEKQKLEEKREERRKLDERWNMKLTKGARRLE